MILQTLIPTSLHCRKCNAIPLRCQSPPFSAPLRLWFKVKGKQSNRSLVDSTLYYKRRRISRVDTICCVTDCCCVTEYIHCDIISDIVMRSISVLYSELSTRLLLLCLPLTLNHRCNGALNGGDWHLNGMTLHFLQCNDVGIRVWSIIERGYWTVALCTVILV